MNYKVKDTFNLLEALKDLPNLKKLDIICNFLSTYMTNYFKAHDKNLVSLDFISELVFGISSLESLSLRRIRAFIFIY